MAISPALREYAETPDRFALLPEGGSVVRFADERVCILQGPTWASVSGVRAAASQVEALLAEVRGRVARERAPIWSVGPSAEPPDLYERLHAAGLGEPRDRAALLHAVVLTGEPAPAPPGVDVRRVETYEQFRAARELQWDAFEMPADRRARNRARLRDDFAEDQRLGVPVTFLATLDGRPAAAAAASPSEWGVFLIGGATAPWARGRGLYRALVRARWDYAVARGTAALVTHAVPRTSYPILRRLGFEDVCTLRRLEDARA
ncbi:MAG: GNAT family N-acetyltransferase [Thermoleophilia bacterium]|nr:GNAT family N-acetyltransferase [Thermoleophilia bacterium]